MEIRRISDRSSSWVGVDDQHRLVTGGAAAAMQNLKDDNADGNTYFGEAVPGTATSAAGWQILRMNVSGTVTSFKYANGDSGYTNVWDNRTSLTYS